MSLSRQQSVFTYNSTSGGVTYYFDVVVDAQGLISVKNIRSPQGAIDSSTNLPDSVINDISAAKLIVQQLVSETSVDSGTITFTGQTERPVVIVPGTLNNTNYRVVYTTTDGTSLTTESQTTTGFNAVVGSAYGTPSAPKTVAYVVLVKTQQASVTSGTLTFTPGVDTQAVVFSPAFKTDQYHVILSENGPFKAAVTAQTKAGFTVEIGYTVPAAETASVGYDVFVG